MDGEELTAVLACQRRVIGVEVHRKRAWFNLDRRERFAGINDRNRIRDQNVIESGKHRDFSRTDGFDILKIDSLIRPKFCDVERNFLNDIFTNHFDSVADFDGAAKNLSAKHAAKVIAVVEVVDLKSEWTFKLNLWLRNVLKNGFEQHSHILIVIARILSSVAANS